MVKCTNCVNCTDKCEDQVAIWYWCEADRMWMNDYWALSDLECDLYVEKLDDNETEESEA